MIAGTRALPVSWAENLPAPIPVGPVLWYMS